MLRRRRITDEALRTSLHEEGVLAVAEVKRPYVEPDPAASRVNLRSVGTAGETDLVLFERWRGGNAQAGNELFERHFDAVYRFFAHKAPNDAVDLVQRTFLGCVEARDRFRAASSFRTFLLAIARHQLLAHWRRRAALDADPSTSSVRDLSPSPSALLVERAEQRLLLEGLRAIPLELQIALELHYWEELSMAEIAEVLDVPEGTAKSRLRRAREALVDALSRIERDPVRLASTRANLEVWAASLRDRLSQQ